MLISIHHDKTAMKQRRAENRARRESSPRAKLFQPPYRYAGSCDSLPAARQLRGGGIRHIQASGICVMIRKVDYLWT